MNVSIIIPVYNVKSYICECLDSLLNQQFSDFEIICVDDYSIDGTYDILMQYAEKCEMISVLRNSKNMGAAKSRNAGLFVAKGKYVIFLDGDDIFDRRMLANLYDSCEKKQAQVAYCTYSYFEDRNDVKLYLNFDKELLEGGGLIDSEKKRELLYNHFIFSPCNKLVLRELLIQNRIEFQDISNANDVYYSLIVMSLAHTIVVVNESLFLYRYKRIGNISESRENKRTYLIWAIEHYIKEMIDRNLWTYEWKKLIMMIIINHCWYFLRNDKMIAKQLIEDFKERMVPLWDKDITNGRIWLSPWRKYQYECLQGKRTVDENIRRQIFNEELGQYIVRKKTRKMALWGAGRLAERVLNEIETIKECIEVIIDNDTKKQGTFLCGVPVVSYTEAVRMVDEVIVLNAKFYKEIKEQVDGVLEVYDFNAYLNEIRICDDIS